VSLPATDEYDFIAASIDKTDHGKAKVNSRLESLTMPPASPDTSRVLLSRPTIKQKRFAGTFTKHASLMLHGNSSNLRPKSMASSGSSGSESVLNDSFNPFMSSKLGHKAAHSDPVISLTENPLKEHPPPLSETTSMDDSSQGHEIPVVHTPAIDAHDFLNQNSDTKESNDLENYFRNSKAIYANALDINFKTKLTTVNEENFDEDDELEEFRLSLMASKRSQQNIPSFQPFTQPQSNSNSNSIVIVNMDSSPDVPKFPIPVVEKQIVFVKAPLLDLKDQTFQSKRVSALNISKLPGLSALSQMVDSTNQSNNPFARDFSFFVFLLFLIIIIAWKSRRQLSKNDNSFSV
jgi:hypothetical protein